MFVLQKILAFIKANIFSGFCLFHIKGTGYFKYLKSLFHFSFFVDFLSKTLMRLNQRGMMLLEMILIALFLGAIVVGTAYYFAQTKATLSSSSQATSCQHIIKQALENTVSLGSRLYGYKINHKTSDLSYTPLFIKKNAKAYDVDGNIEDVNDGSELSFPPEMYKTLFKNLGVSVSLQSPKDNNNKFIIGDTYPYDLSTSTLLVNSVNALQYLYNSDNGFFTANSGKGKKYTTSTINNGGMSSLLQKYEDQFGVEDIEFYIKISPIDLQINQVMSFPSSHILTRPRFHNPSSMTLSPALNVLGDENIGFEIRVLLKYSREDQEYECEGMHRFTHQVKPITRKNELLPVNLTGLVSRAGKDFLADPGLQETSCDTDGTGYDDITITLDFNNVGEGQQAGSVILCRVTSYCRSFGNESYGSCSTQRGRWQRCNDVQPKPSSDQSWTYKAKLKSEQELVMTFENMTPDRRYVLDVGEFSIAGYHLRLAPPTIFFIDATRPSIGNVSIISDTVGTPTDQREDRNYDGPVTDWIKPPNSTNKWIQCNTKKVEFVGDIVDQFMHNIKTCVLAGSKQDGNGTSATSPKATFTCGGELSSVAHGRQTITFQPSDSCSYRVTPPDLGTPKNLVWDADLPSTFQTQNFPSHPFWLRHRRGDIKTVVPGTGIGKFPKHYSVDCDDNYMGQKKRRDGNSGTLSCNLDAMTNPPDPADLADADGCNPNDVLVKYYHVCGGAGNCERGQWAVYAPSSKSCKNVQCKPDLVCCDSSKNIGGSCTVNKCYDPGNYTDSCTNPKGGDNNSQDSKSGCPPAGLFNCNYTLPCDGTSPFSATDASGCSGKRKGDTCSFSYGGAVSCNPSNPTGWQSTMPDLRGTCNYPEGYSVSCMAPHRERCKTPCTHMCHDPCHPAGHPRQVCKGSICWEEIDPCQHTTCNPRNCHPCDQMEYKLDGATANSACPTVGVSGTCGDPNGSCTAKTNVGGGNLSLEKCTIRPATCNICDSTTTCCVGDSCPANPNCCTCDSSTNCCPGDSYPTNANCFCVHGTTCPENGVCSENGCAKGIMAGNGAGWYCKGINGGLDTAGCPMSSSYPPDPSEGEVIVSQSLIQACVKVGNECVYNFETSGQCVHIPGADPSDACTYSGQGADPNKCETVSLTDAQVAEETEKNKDKLKDNGGGIIQRTRVECER